jgi:MFS family permease
MATGRRFTFAVASLSIVAAFMASGSPLVLFNIYRLEAGLTHGDLAIAVAAYFVGTIFSLLSFSRLANHLGRRPTSFLALVLVLVGTLAVLHVPNVWPLTIGRLFMGLGCGLVSSALTAYVVDTAPARPAWGAAVVTSQAPMLGLTLGALAAGAAVDHLPSPRTLIYVMVAVALVACLVAILFCSETHPPSPGALASLRPQVAVPRRVRPIMPAAIVVFVATWGMGSYYQAYGAAVTRDWLHSDTAMAVGLVLASFVAAGVVGSPLAGRFTPATGQRLGMTVFMLGVGGVVASLFRGSLGGFLVGSLLAGAGQGIAIAATLRGILSRITEIERAPVMAAVFLICYTGGMVPSLVSGQLTRFYELDQLALGYAAMALIATVCTWLWARDRAESSPPIEHEGVPHA